VGLVQGPVRIRIPEKKNRDFFVWQLCTYRRVGLVEGPVRIRITEQNVLQMADVLHGQSEGVQLAQLKKKLNN
jgi:hypothetical protein